MTELYPPTVPLDMSELAPPSRALYDLRRDPDCRCIHCWDRELPLGWVSDSRSR